MRTAGQPVYEVIRRPGARHLHLAIFHHRAGGCELVLIPLHTFALDQVRYVQDHLPGLGEPTADLFV